MLLWLLLGDNRRRGGVGRGRVVARNRGLVLTKQVLLLMMMMMKVVVVVVVLLGSLVRRLLSDDLIVVLRLLFLIRSVHVQVMSNDCLLSRRFMLLKRRLLYAMLVVPLNVVV